MFRLPGRGLKHASASRYHSAAAIKQGPGPCIDCPAGASSTLPLLDITAPCATVIQYLPTRRGCLRFRSRRPAGVYERKGKTFLVSNQPRTDPDDTRDRGRPSSARSRSRSRSRSRERRRERDRFYERQPPWQQQQQPCWPPQQQQQWLPQQRPWSQPAQSLQIEPAPLGHVGPRGPARQQRPQKLACGKCLGDHLTRDCTRRKKPVPRKRKAAAGAAQRITITRPAATAAAAQSEATSNEWCRISYY